VFDRSYDQGDAFAAKLTPTGGALGYATFLGGSDGDAGYAIAVDGTGNAYVAGTTQSADSPATPGAFDTSFNGGACGGIPCSDAFVTAVQKRSRWWLPLVSRNQTVR
jgi:hypothetical protein